MSHKQSEQRWREDFQEFIATEEVKVPDRLTNEIISKVREDLAAMASPWIVFLKLSGLHLVAGTLSLGLCNQFGMNPFSTSFSLSQYMMKFGHSFCMFFCGVLFMGLTVGISRIVLRPAEFAVLRRNAPLQIFVLSLLSLAVFLFVGAQIVFGIGLLWFLGSMAGGVISARLPRAVRHFYV